METWIMNGNFRWIPVFLLGIILSLPLFGEESNSASKGSDRPNILWLSTEDIGCQLSCYGDSTVATPNLDRLARNGVVYDFAWSNYPVCAPARTTIITGMYAAANGAGNMRSDVRLTEGIKMFPQLLRDAGYACYNNNKEDYNHPKPRQVWDQSSRRAHFRNRQAGQPFFSVFNYTGTHESKIRVRPHEALVDPAKVFLAPYWPDNPEVRQDWAQYYDNLSKMDRWLGNKLAEFEKKRTGKEHHCCVFRRPRFGNASA